jgi:serine/threonine-protein kinase
MIGNVVGNYKITEKIGEGGMGAVFKGVDLMLEREVAVKVLRPEFSSQPELVERFRAEAVTLAKLNHPNIATLHSFFRQGNDFFMVMEYVRGEALDSVIRRGGAMAPQQAVVHFCQALDGIGRAHKLGIVHRDIKPANVMITEDGSIKVMDFGIARVLGTARMTKQGNIIGTIEYMSPEAIQGHEVDARADIYSLGILLYEMLTGRVPFEADTEFSLMMAQIQQAPPPPRTFAPHIPLGVEQAIMRSLAKKPEARFQTAADFRGALEAGGVAATTLPTAAKPTVPPTRLGELPTAPHSQQVTMPLAPGSDPTGLATAQGGQPKETRLGGGGAYGQPSYQPVVASYAPEVPVSYQTAHSHSSFFSRLNWKHYSVAAIILLTLLAVPVVLIAVLKGQVPPPQPPPAADRPPATATPSPTVESSVPAPNPVTTQPAIAPGGEPPRAPSGPSEAAYPAGSGTSSGDKKAKPPSRREGDTAAAREKARKAAEARRLLNQ